MAHGLKLGIICTPGSRMESVITGLLIRTDDGPGLLMDGIGIVTSLLEISPTIMEDGTRDDYYGWLWMPDNEWGPAWVEWRYDNDYVGWAPLSPYATFSITAGLRFSVQYESPYTNWMFVRYHNFCEPRLNSYYIPASYRSRIFRNTTYRADYAYRDNRVINRGVDVNIIESRGRVTVKERNITIVNNPRGDVRGGQRDRIEVFAPKREDMRRADISNVKIIRSDRQTNLEVNKVNVWPQRRFR